jgi:hypothetical protein
LTDGEFVELHLEAQFALSRGVSSYAVGLQLQLERELCRSLEVSVWSPDVIDALLDELHTRAYPSPMRPPRLEIERSDPRE